MEREKLKKILKKLKTASFVYEELKKAQRIDDLKKLNVMFNATLKILNELKKDLSEELKKLKK